MNLCDGIFRIPGRAATLLEKIKRPIPYFAAAGFFGFLDILNICEKLSLEKIHSVCCNAITAKCNASLPLFEEQFFAKNITVICSDVLPTKLFIRESLIIGCSALCAATVLFGMGISATMLYDRYEKCKARRRQRGYDQLEGSREMHAV